MEEIETAPIDTSLDNNRQVQARHYARLMRRLTFLEAGCIVILLGLLIITPISKYLVGLFSLSVVPAAVIYFILMTVGYTFITAPLSYYSGFILPHHYGLSHQRFRGWLADSLKGSGLTLLLGAGLIAAIYWLMNLSAGWWWIWAWLMAMVISLVLSILAPVFILPMFYKTQPLPAGDLNIKLKALAHRAGINIQGIYVAEFSTKTTTANAALMGIGRTRRIIISDTLIQQYTSEEILVVMGHEIGHQRHRDVWRLFAYQGIILLLTFYITSRLLQYGVNALDYQGITDAAALPLVILLTGALGFFTAPLLSGFSRYIESQADRYTLHLTRDPDSYISAITRLTNQNLSEATPPRWVEVLLDDHPSYRQRMATAERFIAGQVPNRTR
jgi:STE24 endopeptidase